MRNIKILTFLAIIAVALFACKKEEPKPEPPIIVADNVYAGQLTVNNNGVSEISDLEINLITTAKEDSVVLLFNKVKFIAAMPVGFDIKVPVKSSSPNCPSALSGTGITPYLGNVLYQSFRVDNVQGIVTNDSLKVDMEFVVVQSMGILAQGQKFPTNFAGKIKQ
ncbi:MAG: hypothetical protein FWF72_05875 [Paludibacter sp.]|nr:hypothetical protein [Paludibacter sp.]